MRYFICADNGKSFNYFMEEGWIYTHDPSKDVETESTIEIDSEYSREHHEECPKGVLIEITKDDYDLLMMFVVTGYDNTSAVNEITEHRRGDGSNEKPYAIEDSET